MANRAGWAAYIRDNSVGGRYLYAAGNAEWSSDFVDDPEIEAFVSNLRRLGADGEVLARLYYLLLPEVADFMHQQLPSLLRSSSHSSSAVRETSNVGLKGTPDWAKTAALRASGAIGSAGYVVRIIHRSANTPENQLLKLYCRLISSNVRTAEGLVGSGALLRALMEVGKRSAIALKSSYMSEVSTVAKATSLMRLRARRNKNPAYGKLVELQLRLDSTIVQSKWEAILELLRQGWLCPVANEDLFELYTLVRILDCLSVGLGFGRPIEQGLIRSGRKHVCRFRRPTDGIEAFVYFDQSPSSVFGIRTEYGDLARQYVGLVGGERRPDIMIRFVRRDGTERRMIIECKESEDPAYINEGVYKVIAYLRDFHSLWKEHPEQSPKALLAIPSSLRPLLGPVGSGDLIIADLEDDQGLSALLARAVS